MVKLETCDIILWKNIKSDPISGLSRWAIGPWGHVAMYLGKFRTHPMVYESRARGVNITSLLPQTGATVAVMRPWIRIPQSDMVWTAFEIAADEKSFFDYFAVVHSVLPRVLIEKLHLPLPPIYHRDIFMVCSEAVAEVWWRNGIEVVSKNVIPLPTDFRSSYFLICVGEGKLMEDIVP